MMEIKIGGNPNTGKENVYCKCCGHYGLESGATGAVDVVIATMNMEQKHYTCDICGEFGTLEDFARWGKH